MARTIYANNAVDRKTFNIEPSYLGKVWFYSYGNGFVERKLWECPAGNDGEDIYFVEYNGAFRQVKYTYRWELALAGYQANPNFVEQAA